MKTRTYKFRFPRGQKRHTIKTTLKHIKMIVVRPKDGFEQVIIGNMLESCGKLDIAKGIVIERRCGPADSLPPSSIEVHITRK